VTNPTIKVILIILKQKKLKTEYQQINVLQLSYGFVQCQTAMQYNCISTAVVCYENAEQITSKMLFQEYANKISFTGEKPWITAIMRH